MLSPEQLADLRAESARDLKRIKEILERQESEQLMPPESEALREEPKRDIQVINQTAGQAPSCE